MQTSKINKLTHTEKCFYTTKDRAKHIFTTKITSKSQLHFSSSGQAVAQTLLGPNNV